MASNGHWKEMRVRLCIAQEKWDGGKGLGRAGSQTPEDWARDLEEL